VTQGPQDPQDINRSPKGRARELLIVQRKLVNALLCIVFACFAVMVINYFADIFRILGISVLIAYLFYALVDWLNKHIPNRAACVFIIYSLVISLLVFLAVTFVPTVFYQVHQLSNWLFGQIPNIIHRLSIWVKPVDDQLHSLQINAKALDLLAGLAQTMPSPDPSFIINRMSEMAMSTMTWSVYGLSILVLSFYFLLDGHGMSERVISLFPKRTRVGMSTMASEIDSNLQSFFRGQVVMAVAFALVMLAIYLALGVPFALVLALILAFFEVIPVIGPPMGFIPVIFVVALNGLDNIHIERIWQVVLLLIVINVAQWLKDNVVAPRYIGNAVGLHPVIIFLAILVGSKVDGLLGVIFAIPAASAINVIGSYLIRIARGDMRAKAVVDSITPDLD